MNRHKPKVDTRGPRSLQATAYHEAGHAVIARANALRVKNLSILANENSYGRIIHEGFAQTLFDKLSFGAPNPNQRVKFESHIMTSLAGFLAEKKLTGRGNAIGATLDRRCAVEIIEDLVANREEAEAYLHWLIVRTKNALNTDHIWQQVEAVADALIKNGGLTNKEFDVIAKSAGKSKTIK